MPAASEDSSPMKYAIGHHEDVLQAFSTHVGCGSGNITRDLARICPDGHTVGVDASSEVVQRSINETELTDLAGRVTFRVADVLSLPFDDDSFDVVHAHQVLQFLADPTAALLEMRRVAKPGGFIAVRVTCNQEIASKGLERILPFSSLIMPAIAAAGGEPNVARNLPCHAREAGLEIVSKSASLMSFISKEERRELAQMWRGVFRSDVMKTFMENDVGEKAPTTDELNDYFELIEDSDDQFYLFPNVEILCTK